MHAVLAPIALACFGNPSAAHVSRKTLLISVSLISRTVSGGDCLVSRRRCMAEGVLRWVLLGKAEANMQDLFVGDAVQWHSPQQAAAA